MFVCAKLLTSHFFSVYNLPLCPCCGGTTTLSCTTLAPFINPTLGTNHIKGYFSGGETEEEWPDNTELAEVSAQFKLVAEGNEVHFHLTPYQFNLSSAS
jgi:hypothetical protein